MTPVQVGLVLAVVEVTIDRLSARGVATVEATRRRPIVGIRALIPEVWVQVIDRVTPKRMPVSLSKFIEPQP